MPRRNTHPTHPQGFTLTELLVVIAIVAMLAALVSVAVVRALDTAKQVAIKTELDMIDAAMKSYKEKYGSYPPCIMPPAGPLFNQLRQHVSQAFPRYDLAHLENDLNAAGIDRRNFRPDQALVFWLRGFGPDPAHPFVDMNDMQLVNGVPTVKVSRTQFFDFDQSRLDSVRSVSNWNPTATMYSYFPPRAKVGSDGAPYLYFEARFCESNRPGVSTPPAGQPRWMFNIASARHFENAGTGIYYAHDLNGNGTFDTDEKFVNPESFQIVSAGMDGKYGDANIDGMAPARLYPTGTFYDTSTNLADDDNVTNFCDSARLIDAKP